MAPGPGGSVGIQYGAVPVGYGAVPVAARPQQKLPFASDRVICRLKHIQNSSHAGGLQQLNDQLPSGCGGYPGQDCWAWGYPVACCGGE